MTRNDDTLGRLAQSMVPVVEAIGVDATIALVTRFGGTTIYVRKEAVENDPIALVIGIVARNKLRDAGFTQFEVPQCRAWLIARRDEEIRLRAQAGEPQASLARRFGLTTRHIRNICIEGAGVDAVPAHQELTTEPTP